jgi:predicted outer membrane repeat protein
MRRTLSCVAVLLTLGLAGFSPAAAQTTHTVTDCGDTTPGGAPGQLRTLIVAAGAGDTIVIPATCSVITLTGTPDNDDGTTGDLDVLVDLTIQGQGLGLTVIDGGGIDRIFDVLAGVDLTLQKLTIRNGNATTNAGTKSGGGIYNEDGNLTLTDVAVTGNTADNGGGIFDNNGTMTLTNVVVSGNTATVDGGGIFSALTADSVTNSTVSDNTAAGEGGGIVNNGPMTLLNVTVADNQATTEGGGVATTASGSTSIQNTILSGNTAAASPDCDGVTTLHNTLISDTTGCTVSGTPDATDLTGSANLNPLANNGGGTLTRALQGNSVAVNAGNPAACPPTDQRGVARAGVCDIGAYEHDPTVIIAGYVNQVSYAPGETLTVGVNAFNGGAAMVVDVYAVILPPAGVVPGCTTSAAFVIIGGAVLLCADTTPFDQFPALASNVPLGTMTTAIVADIFSVALTGAPPGLYEYIVLVVDAGAAADGVFTGAEIRSISRIPWFVI